MDSLPTMKAIAPGGRCVVGLGGDFGDDRLGWWIVDRLRAVVRGSVRLVRAGNPVDLLGLLDGVRELIVIDACQGLGATGEVLRLTWPTAQLEKLRRPLGHNITLDTVFDLAERLGQLPDRCEIWCVEGGQFGFGQTLSPEVAVAAQRLLSEFAARFSAVGSYA